MEYYSIHAVCNYLHNKLEQIIYGLTYVQMLLNCYLVVLCTVVQISKVAKWQFSDICM